MSICVGTEDGWGMLPGRWVSHLYAQYAPDRDNSTQLFHTNAARRLEWSGLDRLGGYCPGYLHIHTMCQMTNLEKVVILAPE
jgi:hypothetical protein